MILNRIGGGGGHGGSEGGGEGEGEGSGNGGGGMQRGENVPEAVHTFLTENQANLYEGQAADETGSSEVSISVGAGDNGLAFEPAAVLVDAGTTITWEWTGNGGAHNVVSAEDSATEFRSGSAQSGGDITFSQTFDSAGNQLYYCSPHQAVGMYGAVIVQ
ncbi:halocyanin domain-containing protein [Halovenus carboxidivorans]|uniref:halocyanin domain-containing protein n=1 Tax=Halovenus carboxidivorans TaxID=2692199 RepID=UPI00191650B5